MSVMAIAPMPLCKRHKSMISSKKQRDLEKRTVTLINVFRGRMRDQLLDDYVDLAVNLEWGVAFEMLCDQLFEFEVVPTGEELGKIAVLGNDIGIDPKYWQHWKEK